MKVSELERVVIVRFLADPAVRSRRRSVNFEVVNVRSREFTGAGFITEFSRSDELKVFDGSVSMRWGGVGAWLDESQVDTGYLVYVDDGYVAAIEGYTYGEDWPVEVRQVRLYGIEGGSS